MIFPYKIVDLTHTLHEDIPSWNGGCGFINEIKHDYSDSSSDIKFRVQKIKMHAGIGTHLDAPAHCIPKGAAIDELKLNKLIAPCVMVDVSASMHEQYTASVKDIENFESLYGQIREDDFVMIRTGWEKFWPDKEKYRNNHLFPSVSAEAALLLLKRKVSGIGIDTLSPDRPENGFLVHKLFLKAQKYIVENAANLETLPPRGSFILAIPIKIKDATEAPIRLIGLINLP